MKWNNPKQCIYFKIIFKGDIAMNLKKLTTLSLFLAMGFIFHQISPPIFFGIKPDFLLTMMIMSIFLCENYKEAFLVGILFGIFAAMTTGFPGGQLPNVIDKIVSALFVYSIKSYSPKNNNLKVSMLSFLGTLVSGIVFLVSVSIMVALPAKFIILFSTVVLPTSILNTVASLGIYKLIIRIKSISVL